MAESETQRLVSIEKNLKGIRKKSKKGRRFNSLYPQQTRSPLSIKHGGDTIKIGNRIVYLDDYIKAMHSDGKERQLALRGLSGL